MAKKLKCHECGAKNAIDVRRCRACGTVINADVVERPVGAERGMVVGAGEGGPPSDEQLRAMGYDTSAVPTGDAPSPDPAADEPFDPNALDVPWAKPPSDPI